MYLIGQRVIYSKVEIVTILATPLREHPAPSGYQWIDRAAGYPHCVALSNLEPLPGGQL